MILRLAARIALICGLVGCAVEADAPEVAERSDELFVLKTGLWPDARIPVCWDSQSMASKYDADRWWIQDAVHATWEAVSSVRFRGWAECTETEAAGSGIRVVIYDGPEGGQTQVGKKQTGQTRSSIPNCNTLTTTREACVRRLAVHELGHALSFRHEHARPDATSSCKETLSSYTNHETFGASEDINGVLNYCNPLTNGGGRLSATDVRGVRHYYGGDGWALDANLFDPDFYLQLYPDLRRAFGDDLEEATIHWLSMGLPVEGRRGNRSFDVQYYLNYYSDVANAIGTVSQHRFAEAAHHWLAFGIGSEGRRGSREFDPQYYRNAYSDLNNTFGSNWAAYRAHYEWFGAQVEGRRASASFDVRYYLASYEDLRNAFGSDYNAALVHWITDGFAHGRRGAP